eukprot:6199535-Pleurochrysis_carterae.AAC.3
MPSSNFDCTACDGSCHCNGSCSRSAPPPRRADLTAAPSSLPLLGQLRASARDDGVNGHAHDHARAYDHGRVRDHDRALCGRARACRLTPPAQARPLAPAPRRPPSAKL